ncbi:MAG: preprotein translocase subunit SecA [Candidatus Omnitrophica bacterium]|nr:preprotein translocase subunit SecA [Candidatus Omnitrophota bacterium]
MPSPSMKEITNLSPLLSKINALEKDMEEQSDSFFKKKTFEYKDQIKQQLENVSLEKHKEITDKILEETLPFYFAMIREASKRTLKMRHFDVQILGGILLHRNKIAEMVTGEGKTLVATLAVSLNALTGKGVHVVTVNDYLAKRDMEWMFPLYDYLGLTCTVIQQDMPKEKRRFAYNCDITYGTNNEFGFDYLRDNMVNSSEEMVQQTHYFAVVDEVDSILVDEARTPLIISGPAESYIDKYYIADKVIRQIKRKVIIQSFDNKDGTVTIKDRNGNETRMEPQELEEKYEAIVEEKTHHSYFTSKGEKKCEQLLGVNSLSDDCPDNLSNPWINYLTKSLTAHELYHRDQQYIAKDGRVIIVDDFTGRLMPGRRWSDGLHQAVEAKEELTIQEESQTLATITLQNYFRMYDKLAGMTGTAYTEANEFNHIYKLDVVVLPTNKPLIRLNFSDRIYKNKKVKFNAVIKEIEELYELKRPVLVGTTSIEDSETLSFLLNKKGVPHNILNAKYHEKEASIVAQAGRLGQVTIATNMAGRGTDIVLGGNLDYYIKDILMTNKILPGVPEYKEEYEKLYQKHKGKFEEFHDKVVELEGVHIIGTQRHESRRIDNQLRGRSGRQGDPGSSRFYISLEDDLMRLFGSDKITRVMETFKFPEDEPIEHMIISHSIAGAQKRVENHNFEIRKQLLQYDDIMNKQREVVYTQRKEILQKDNINEDIFAMLFDVIDKNIPIYFQEEKDLLGLIHWIKSKFDLDFSIEELQNFSMEDCMKFLKEKISEGYQKKEMEAGSENMRNMEKIVALWIVDSRWKEHLLTMDHLREGIHLRAHAQIEPLVAYQKESYFAFQEMIDSIKEGISEMIFRARLKPQEKEVGVFNDSPKNFIHSEYSSLKKGEVKKEQVKTIRIEGKRVGRNDPCTCGSGKKYKKCCGL